MVILKLVVLVNVTEHGAVDFNDAFDVDGAVTLIATLDVDDDATFHNDITLDTTGKNFQDYQWSQDNFPCNIYQWFNTDIRG